MSYESIIIHVYNAGSRLSLVYVMPNKNIKGWSEGIETTEMGHLQLWLPEAQNQGASRVFWFLLGKFPCL